VPRFGRIRMQAIGFAAMAFGMLLLMIAVSLSNSFAGTEHIPLVFGGFILFNLLMNAGPNSTTFTLAPILFPTELRATASGFAAGVAKIGATLGVFVLPILKGTFGVPAVLGMMAVVSFLGLVGPWPSDTRIRKIELNNSRVSASMIRNCSWMLRVKTCSFMIAVTGLMRWQGGCSGRESSRFCPSETSYSKGHAFVTIERFLSEARSFTHGIGA
jgi:MFS family permease